MNTVTDAKNKVMATMVVMVLLALGLWYFLAEPKVAVKIYLHRESGNFIYCETGTLTDEFHDYQGEGKIAESKAVAC